VVELGVHRGASLTAFSQGAKECGLSSKIFGVDTWGGDAHTGEYGEEIFEELQNYVTRYDFPVRLLRKTFSEALHDIEDGSVDLLHIDGFHTYNAVEQDFRTWLPKLSKHSVVLLHDINVFERDFGVHKLWREVSSKFPNFQFLHGHGLGVLATGGEIPLQVKELFGASDNRHLTDRIRESYHTLGLSISRAFEISLRLDTELTDTKLLRYIVSPEANNLESIKNRTLEMERLANELSEENTKLQTECDSLLSKIAALSNEIDYERNMPLWRRLLGIHRSEVSSLEC